MKRKFISSKKPKSKLSKTSIVSQASASARSGMQTSKKYKKRNLLPKAVAITQFGFPEVLVTNLRYCEDVNLGSWGAATGFADIAYRGNGPYDPYVGAGGTQSNPLPLLGTLYAQMYVYSSTIKVTVNNGDDEALIASLMCRGDQTAITDKEDAWTSRFTSKNLLLSHSGGGKDCVILKDYMTTQRMRGTGHVDEDEGDWTSTTTGTPTSQWHWHLILKKGTAEAFVGRALVEIVYRVKLWSPVFSSAG